MKLLPVALNIAGQSTLIVGGGRVATRKVLSLLECGAEVTLIAPTLNSELQALQAQLKYFDRAWQSGDCRLENFALVFACTDNRAINHGIAQEARASGIWCNIANDAGASDFHGAAEVRRGDICIGITTGGGSPALSSALKSKIEECIGDEWALLLELMSARRSAFETSAATQKERAAIWRTILNSDALDLLRTGKRAEAECLIDELMKRPEREDSGR